MALLLNLAFCFLVLRNGGLVAVLGLAGRFGRVREASSGVARSPGFDFGECSGVD